MVKKCGENIDKQISYVWCDKCGLYVSHFFLSFFAPLPWLVGPCCALQKLLGGFGDHPFESNLL